MPLLPNFLIPGSASINVQLIEPVQITTMATELSSSASLLSITIENSNDSDSLIILNLTAHLSKSTRIMEHYAERNSVLVGLVGDGNLPLSDANASPCAVATAESIPSSTFKAVLIGTDAVVLPVQIPPCESFVFTYSISLADSRDCISGHFLSPFSFNYIVTDESPLSCSLSAVPSAENLLDPTSGDTDLVIHNAHWSLGTTLLNSHIEAANLHSDGAQLPSVFLPREIGEWREGWPHFSVTIENPTHPMIVGAPHPINVIVLNLTPSRLEDVSLVDEGVGVNRFDFILDLI